MQTKREEERSTYLEITIGVQKQVRRLEITVKDAGKKELPQLVQRPSSRTRGNQESDSRSGVQRLEAP